MELKVRKIGNGYGVILPKPLLEDLAVGEGSLLKAENRDGVLQMTPVDVEFFPSGRSLPSDRRAAPA